MKKHGLLLVVLLSAGCTDTSDFSAAPAAGTAPEMRPESCVPGLFRIKLADTAPELDTRAFTRSGGSGDPEFDAAATRAGALSIRRVFSDGGRFRERRRQAGLHRWYDVHFDETRSVEEAMELFGHPEGVVWMEPVPRMVPTSATVIVPAGEAPCSTLPGPAFDDPLQGNQWFLHNDGTLAGQRQGADLNIRPAWSVSTGSREVIVAVADGGIDRTHPDLAADMWDDGEGHCGYNFCRDSYEITPSDHGTHVAGIIGAVNNNGIGICGIAGGDGSPGSGVRLMSCQIFDDTGSATIEELMAWSADHGAVISQNSWSYTGLDDLSQSGKEAIDYFIEHAGCDEAGNQVGPMKGGIVIFAAGNDGISTPQYPAAYPPVLAVASLGADLRKAATSNYGPWIDLAALGGDSCGGDERYGIYSTIPGNHYGFAAGTSMACPQVSGLAALAVAKLGGPGFTNHMLEELLLGSGRRLEVEACNPEYAGQLGKGLVDAEYLFFHEAVPEAVRDATASGGSSRLTLAWSVPADYLGRAVTDYGVYLLDKPFTAATLEEIPANAREYTVKIEGKAVGERCTFDADGLEAQTEYWAAIVSRSRYGTPSAPCLLTASTLDNTPPALEEPMPDLFLSSGNAEGIALDLTSRFVDPDAPNDALSYFVAFPEGSVVDGRIVGNLLHLYPREVGTSTLSVIACDRYGASVAAPLRVMVDGTGVRVELFPNPCSERLNFRIPGATGSFPVKIRDRGGREVLTATVTLRETGNGNTGWINVAQLPSGVYTCRIDYFGVPTDLPFIKR